MDGDLKTWVQGFYVLTAIFGCGVTAIDMLGILGSSESSDGGDAGDGGADVGELMGDGEASAADPAALDGDIDADAGAATELADGPSSGHGPGPGTLAPISLLVVMRNLRRAVYFSLAFGPVGLVALSRGAGVLQSLLWAVPSGIVSLLLAGAFFRFQQRDLDSTVSNRDLFYQRGEILVPIARGGMGRVRVFVGQSVVDRFARAELPEQSFQKGESVYITRISDSCVFVERPAAEQYLDQG